MPPLQLALPTLPASASRQGPAAALLNRQFAVGAVGTTAQYGNPGAAPPTNAIGGTDFGGNNFISFAPPLDTSTAQFDARYARVGLVTRGAGCRAGAGLSGAWGASQCVFSTPSVPNPDESLDPLLSYGPLRYTAQLAGPGGAMGTTGQSATFQGSTAEGGPAVAERQQFQFGEERREQAMDNVLAFQYNVLPVPPPFGGSLTMGFDTYSQSAGGLAGNANELHLTSDLDYRSTAAMAVPLGGALLRACAETFLIKSIACEAGGTTRVTVYGKHPFAVGDTLVLEGFAAANRDPARPSSRRGSDPRPLRLSHPPAKPLRYRLPPVSHPPAIRQPSACHLSAIRQAPISTLLPSACGTTHGPNRRWGCGCGSTGSRRSHPCATGASASAAAPPA